MTHAELLAAIQLAYSKGDTRLFRMQAGVAWQGNVVEHTQSRLVLVNPRAVRLGPEGMSDICGWRTLAFRDHDSDLLTPVAVFTAIECKTGTGRLTREQRGFIELVNESGGRAGVARSLDDAHQILRGEPK